MLKNHIWKRTLLQEHVKASKHVPGAVCISLISNMILEPRGGGTPYLKWQVCAYSKSKVGAYQVKCVLSKIWGHSVKNPRKKQAIPYQVQYGVKKTR